MGTLNAPNALEGEAGVFPLGNCPASLKFPLAGWLNMGIDAYEADTLAVDPDTYGILGFPCAP